MMMGFVVACCVGGSSNAVYSTASSGSDNDVDKVDDFIPPKQELHLQGVDPGKGWDFRGVHKVCICSTFKLIC